MMSRGKATPSDPRPPPPHLPPPGNPRRQGGEEDAGQTGVQAPSPLGWGPGQREGPTRTGGGTAGLVGDSAVRRRGLGLSSSTFLFRRIDSVPSPPQGHQVLSQHLPQREFIKQGLLLCGYSSSLLARPDSGIKGDSSGQQGPLWAGRASPTALLPLLSPGQLCPSPDHPELPPSHEDRSRI